jgi:hypothetical protein
MSDAPADSNTRTGTRLTWDFHPALTEERLRLYARLLANARRDAVALAAYDKDDDNWSVGCRAYAFLAGFRKDDVLSEEVVSSCSWQQDRQQKTVKANPVDRRVFRCTSLRRRRQCRYPAPRARKLTAET